jgi:hypothetical protein
MMAVAIRADRCGSPTLLNRKSLVWGRLAIVLVEITGTVLDRTDRIYIAMVVIIVAVTGALYASLLVTA